ncbi:MAG: formylglycine-generating enzyme family protein [Bacteroidaceae bacterium]|nr:formylglycine-generating enzyme family protein [Bacteroidaceae bacterium]
MVSYNDCVGFINKLNTLLAGQLPAGRKFRLPTEAQWEFAARGGNKGKNNNNKYSGSNSIDVVAWYDDNSGNRTHPVKQKQANELGLYDMTGNVEEWCRDWYGGYYSSSSQTNPKGPSRGQFRIIRGGSYHYDARSCRVAHRTHNTPNSRYNNNGLRLGID